ncbi:hypothetical protein L861_00185 [Litchfieldella anticariensis FP35 = DSM 16096]|uniref:Oxidase n=1 Tax=Litchfieldella anticariensis (strain DSM 16096 / CECT 5854 / CIP 108499 / LMG 22089 / FP35) TaxID=1121939 RepID=S2KNS9_LITA3|nr:hypothetical protein [Halomonas anticariensis]EPC03747.1 hypothetical protein L861_00185 [Halomonas anticariensis FP35 = DSM 16096]
MNEFRLYLLSWIVLLALLVVVAAGAELLSGMLAIALVLGGALCMIGVIIVMFMGLKTADALLKVYATGGVLWLGFLVVLTMADYMTR